MNTAKNATGNALAALGAAIAIAVGVAALLPLAIALVG